jgi:hypothetical protein
MATLVQQKWVGRSYNSELETIVSLVVKLSESEFSTKVSLTHAVQKWVGTKVSLKFGLAKVSSNKSEFGTCCTKVSWNKSEPRIWIGKSEFQQKWVRHGMLTKVSRWSSVIVSQRKVQWKADSIQKLELWQRKSVLNESNSGNWCCKINVNL